MTYPLVPKSTASLRCGQFWAVPLPDGRYGCGRVLQLNGGELPTKTRAFFGGLHHWRGSQPPTRDTRLGSDFVAFGVMHIKAITTTGGAILGERPLEADGIELPILLSAIGGPGTMILRGADPMRPAERDEWGKHPVLGYWGFDYIAEIAAHAFRHVVA